MEDPQLSGASKEPDDSLAAAPVAQVDRSRRRGSKRSKRRDIRATEAHRIIESTQATPRVAGICRSHFRNDSKPHDRVEAGDRPATDFFVDARTNIRATNAITISILVVDPFPDVVPSAFKTQPDVDATTNRFRTRRVQEGGNGSRCNAQMDFAA